MFCPYCGVNNDRGEAKCFICGKPLPNLDAPGSPAAARAERRAAAQQPEERFAGVGDRMLALIFDRLFIGALLFVFGAWVVDRWGTIDPNQTRGLYGSLAVMALTVFAYHVVFEGAFGTTLGKAMMGLQVRTVGERNRLVAAAIRNVLRVADAIGLYLVGFLFATFTQRRQRVGDLVGGTVVMDAGFPRGGRAAMMLLWIGAIAAALWMSYALCPTCRPFLPQH